MRYFEKKSWKYEDIMKLMLRLKWKDVVTETIEKKRGDMISKHVLTENIHISLKTSIYGYGSAMHLKQIKINVWDYTGNHWL